MQWRLVERAAAEIATGFKKEKAHTPAQVSVQRTDANLGHRASWIVESDGNGGSNLFVPETRLDDLLQGRRILLGKAELESGAWEHWKTLIFSEIHVALCTRRKKYASEVKALKNNSRLLIGAIAGYVAATVRATVAVIAALVAAFLHLVVKIGIATFCQRFRRYASR
jgi:hypothetical protein